MHGGDGLPCRRNQNQSWGDLNDRLGRKDSTLLPAERTNATWVPTKTIANYSKLLQNIAKPSNAVMHVAITDQQSLSVWWQKSHILSLWYILILN